MLAAKNRQTIIDKVLLQEIDLIVIGGGITGAGILLDAQSRGINTVLFEMQDFSQGTSSRSTKLVHGGVRYLAQGDLRLVREALGEIDARKCALEHADSLARALQSLSQRKYDVGVLDLGLPDARGLDVVRHVREAAPDMPLVVLRVTP